jgi:Do/DeqQ family serine protease
MKLYFPLFLVLIFSIAGCRRQEIKVPAKNNKDYVSFKDKQQQAEIKEKDNIQAQSLPGMNFRYAAKKSMPGVVHIKSAYPVQQRDESDLFRDFFGEDFFRQFFRQEQNIPRVQYGSASGVIISEDGYIVTNNHVVENADSLEVILYDKRSYPAEIIGTDPLTDLALLKIAENKLPFIHFGNSDSVEVGDMVLAVGNPFNLESTVTAGIVSAKARNINILQTEGAIESYIQTDAAVNRGNSGGALVDVNGKLIGINAAIATPTGTYAGYSFAVPVGIVQKVIDDLLNYKKVLRGVLGIIISDMDGNKAKALGIETSNGVYIDSLQPNGAAIEAGLQKKDVIIKIDQYDIDASPKLREIVARHRPGEKINLTFIRNKKIMTLPVTLKGMPQITKTDIGSSQLLDKLGIQITDLSDKEKSEIGITYGVKVSAIKPGIISRNTNMRNGFIITRVNGNPVGSVMEFTKALEGKKGGIMLEGVYPGLPGIYYYAFGL